MKDITIPETARTENSIHGVGTVAGVFRDSDGLVVLRFEHPPGVTVPVPDGVETIETFPGRSQIRNHPIADKYHGPSE